MIGRKLKPLLIMVTLTGVLTFLFIKAQEHDVNEHHEMILSIQQLSHQDALLNESILELRADQFSNYDSISSQSKIIRSRLQWFKGVESGFYGRYGHEFDEAIDSADIHFSEKMYLLEKFKSYNGILKNSIFYLPIAIEKYQEESAVALVGIEADKLLREVLLFNTWPDDKNAAQAMRYIDILDRTQIPELQEVSKHAQTILKHRVRMQSVIDEMFALPTAQAIDEIYGVYSEHNAQILKAASLYRTAMYLMALVMLFYLLKLFLTLRRTMSELEFSLKEVAFQKDALDEHAIVVSMDPDGTLNYVNDKFVKTSQFRREEVLGQSWNMLDSNDDSLRDYATGMWASLGVGSRWSGEIKLRRNQGNDYWVDATVVPFMDHENRPIRHVALLSDITERKINQERIYNLAHYDELTKLPNRAYFLDNLEKSIYNTIRSGSKMAVLFLDLDNFKLINDTKGHASGDELLKIVGEHLRTCVRQKDIVSRLGGDEFTITLCDVQSEEQIVSVVERIMAMTDRSVRLGQEDIVISASIGIAMLPDDASDKDTLLKYADIAMYKSKADGKNNYSFFSKDLKKESMQRHSVESELRLAIKENQFELYYQPQLAAASGEIYAAEALIRWNHPEKGLIPPDLFIPILEDSGLILEVGKWVLTTACAQLKHWNELGFSLRVAVNISAYQVRDLHLVDLINQLLQRFPIEADDIELELTESSFLHNTDNTIAVFTALSKTGVRLSLDDFGTGYSSLSHFKKLPLNVLKIDRSFIKGLPEDEHDLAITTTILTMAKNMNLEVVAEGVESAEQFAFLKACGCEYLQGYYISRPLPAEDMPRILNENRVICADNAVVRIARQG